MLTKEAASDWLRLGYLMGVSAKEKRNFTDAELEELDAISHRRFRYEAADLISMLTQQLKAGN